MKVLPEDLARLRAAIEPLDSTDIRARAVALGYTDTRYRWDLLWASKADLRPLWAYGCKDAHIDTALRAIVPDLEKAVRP